MKQGGFSTIREIQTQLRALANPADARQQARFFKTGPGEYGEGDQFFGIRVPVLRKLARQYTDLSYTDAFTLLQSKIHEQRFVALVILIRLFQKADEAGQQRIYRGYLKNTAYINNWDLVDVSAEKIVGDWLYRHPSERDVLQQLRRSRNLWRRRIAVMATFYFIRQGQYRPTLQLARELLGDKHDLIHKAVGWMLREIGNRDRRIELAFLDKHAGQMPRTMLRYAIEKFPTTLRQKYLNIDQGD